MNISPVNSQASTAAALLASAGGAQKLSALPAAEQASAAAGQFEAIMIRQFLQDSVGGMMGGEESGPAGGVYGYLLTDVLANKLTEGGGLGLGRMLQQQLTPATPATPPQGSL
ncbi:MAG: flagellar biosynthesis protein FlgJ [Lacunisphaera sp.]|nr:flagellar biosynthesis protein FlgJ [Lacunisphaera sp.]